MYVYVFMYVCIYVVWKARVCVPMTYTSIDAHGRTYGRRKRTHTHTDHNHVYFLFYVRFYVYLNLHDDTYTCTFKDHRRFTCVYFRSLRVRTHTHIRTSTRTHTHMKNRASVCVYVFTAAENAHIRTHAWKKIESYMCAY